MSEFVCFAFPEGAQALAESLKQNTTLTWPSFRSRAQPSAGRVSEAEHKPRLAEFLKQNTVIELELMPDSV
jgi:hypothetical protein